MILNSQTSSTFQEYGVHFQEKVVHALLIDSKWAQQMFEVLNIKFFDKRYLQFLTLHYFKHYEQYKTFPTVKLLYSILIKELKESNEEVIKSQIVNFFTRLKTNPNLNDIDYVKDKSFDFCKRQSLKEALEQSVDMISSSRYEEVIQVMQKALHLGCDNTIGIELMEDKTRFDETLRYPVPTGLKQLDSAEILNGGISNGELAMVFANSGIGKSHFLVQMGCNALRHGKNVLHYTLEMSETKTALRYDSNFCDIPSNEIISRKDEVVSFYEKNGDNIGKLIVKEFPTNIATVQSLRNHIDRIKVRSFKPDLIIVDYADLLRSAKKSEALRLELDMVYKDLRGLAQDINVPIWTASQANRTSSNSNMLALDSVAESYNKGMIVDFAVSLSRKPDEKYNGTGRMFIAKNRNGVDGKIFYIKMNTACSKIDVLEEADPSNISQMDEQSSAKKQMGEKWNELMKEKDILN